jgi:hypothetical protein
MQSFGMLKRVVYIVTTGLYRINEAQRKYYLHLFTFSSCKSSVKSNNDHQTKHKRYVELNAYRILVDKPQGQRSHGNPGHRVIRKQEVLGRTNCLLSLIRQGPH